MGPINYGALQSQLDLSPLRQGFALRDQRTAQRDVIAERQQVRQLAEAKFTAEQDEDKAYREALTGFSADPSPAALLDISARFPDHSKALQEGFKTYTSGQQRDIIGTTVNVLGAVQAGNIDLAKRTLADRKEALQRAGVDTSHTDAAQRLIASDDPAVRKQGMAYLATVLSGAVGAEDAAKIMENFGIGAKAEREDRRLDVTERTSALAERRIEESERHNRTMEGQGAARVDLSRAAGARAAAKAGATASSGAYEYRVAPDGTIQRRKR